MTFYLYKNKKWKKTLKRANIYYKINKLKKIEKEKEKEKERERLISN